jgi:DNA-directed RNA polymerase specialized sigma24 family protein
MLSDHQKRRQDRPLEYVGDGLAERPGPPATAGEARELVIGWLQRLPAQHAEVMQLTLDGWKGQEIAGITGLAYNTVLSYRAEARRRMRLMAVEDGFTEPAGRRRG